MGRGTLIRLHIMKTTLEERLAGYKAAFLEKVKRTNWEDEEECSYKPRGRKPKQAKPVQPAATSEERSSPEATTAAAER